jgi:SOS response regulatory protein OraA/RecX
MPNRIEIEENPWLEVIGRALAYQCLNNDQAKNGSVLQQAQFLERLGVPPEARAAIIGSSEASLKELARQQKNKKRGSKNVDKKSKK